MHRSVGTIGLLIFLVVAIFAPVISTHDPSSYHGPSLSPPNEQFVLGTNDLGQDLFSQLIHSTRTSLLVGAVVAIISTMISVVIGLLSGYNRRLDPYLMGLCNMLLTIPQLLIVIIVVAFFGSDLWNVILVLSLLSWPAYARIIRSQVLSLQEREYVKAAQMFGAKQFYILYKHILPNIYPLATVKFITTAKSAIGAEASLSFLGLGDVTELSWGMMLHYAFQSDSIFISSAWQWWVLPPTLCIVLLTLCFSFLGYKGESEPYKQWRGIKKQANRKNELLYKEITKQENNPNVLLQVTNLQVRYLEKRIHQKNHYQFEPALNDISLTLYKGEILTLIGESGSGKTTLAKAILGMVPNAEIKGAIYFQGENLMDLETKERNQKRWIDISIIFQDSKQALNPVLKIGEQIDEVLIHHLGMNKQAARERTKSLLHDVGLAPHILTMYPHELSGGMCTRVVIAMAVACEPKLLIADEPTSSLDAITRKKVIELLQEKAKQFDLSMIFITHDMTVVSKIAHTVAVLKGGQIVEQAPVWKVFNKPEHFYTKRLLETRGY